MAPASLSVRLSLFREALDIPGISDDEVLRTAAHTAEEQHKGCFFIGGRLWDIEIFLLGGAEPMTRASMCAPGICDQADVTGFFAARYFDLHQERPPSRPWWLRAEELWTWPTFRLDFAVVGVDNCGTTSLHRNLQQHPEIGFTTEAEDGYFAPGGAPFAFEYLGKHRLLPLRAQAEDFNGKWVGGGERPRFLGVCNPLIHAFKVGREALARIPNLRVIVIVCDPVSRFEKWLFYHARERRYFEECAPNCWRAALEAVDSHAREAGTLAAHLHRLFELFGSENMMVVHQQELRERPKKTYNQLATFIGASRFPPQTEFRRYNSKPGARTGLCRNMSILRALTLRFGPEYKALEQAIELAGATTSTDLLARRGRCGRPSELTDATPAAQPPAWARVPSSEKV